MKRSGDKHGKLIAVKTKKFAYEKLYRGPNNLLVKEMDKILANPGRQRRIKKVDKLLTAHGYK